MDLITRRKLKRRGITNTHQLLAAAGASGSRRQLAQAARIDEEALIRLVERADLARIKGVGATYADLLNWLGVDRVSQLAGQDPTELHRSLQALNAAGGFIRRAPTAASSSPTLDGAPRWLLRERLLSAPAAG